MAKRYANLALSYAILAMIFGVFYREFTKFSHFVGQTNLSFLHTHYFMLGMFFFLMLMLSEKVLSFSDRNTGKLLIVYQSGLNITGLGFLMRGLAQVWGTELSRGLDASISGIAGVGHILMGICMILLLLNIKKRALPFQIGVSESGFAKPFVKISKAGKHPLVDGCPVNWNF